MSLPTLVKTWRFAANLSVPAGVSASESNRYLWWAVYNALCGRLPDNSGPLVWTDSAGAVAAAPAALWVPKSENNTVAVGNNDDVKRITTFADVVFGAFTGGTWSHLYNSALALHIKLRFGSNVFSGTHGVGDAANFGEQSGFNMSFTGYGAANGGTNGTLTVPPLTSSVNNHAQFNAADTGSISDYGVISWGGTSGVASAHKLHVMVSSDGKVWRLVAFRNGRASMFFNIEEPQSPVVIPGAPNHTWNGLDRPIVAWNRGTATDADPTRVLRFDRWSSAPTKTAASFMAQNGNSTQVVRTLLNFSTENVWGQSPVSQSLSQLNAASQLNGLPPIMPIGYVCTSPGYYGRAGLASDLFHGVSAEQGGPAEGDSYPLAGTRNFVHLGCFIHPWNTTVMQTS